MLIWKPNNNKWRQYQKQWQNSDLCETKQIWYIIRKVLIRAIHKMYFLLNLGHCFKSYGHFLSNFGSFYHAHLPNMVMSRGPSCKFWKFFTCPNFTFNIRKGKNVSSGNAFYFRRYQPKTSRGVSTPQLPLRLRSLQPVLMEIAVDRTFSKDETVTIRHTLHLRSLWFHSIIIIIIIITLQASFHHNGLLYGNFWVWGIRYEMCCDQSNIMDNESRSTFCLFIIFSRFLDSWQTNLASFMLSSLESIFISIMYCFSSVYPFGNIISLKNSFLKFFICMKLSHLVMKWTSSSIGACLFGLLQSLHVLFS